LRGGGATQVCGSQGSRSVTRNTRPCILSKPDMLTMVPYQIRQEERFIIGKIGRRGKG
jgi:hypothetical protein